MSKCYDCGTEYEGAKVGDREDRFTTADARHSRAGVYIRVNGVWVHSCSFGVPDASDPNASRLGGTP